MKASTFLVTAAAMNSMGLMADIDNLPPVQIVNEPRPRRFGRPVARRSRGNGSKPLRNPNTDRQKIAAVRAAIRLANARLRSHEQHAMKPELVRRALIACGGDCEKALGMMLAWTAGGVRRTCLH